MMDMDLKVKTISKSNININPYYAEGKLSSK